MGLSTILASGAGTSPVSQREQGTSLTGAAWLLRALGIGQEGGLWRQGRCVGRRGYGSAAAGFSGLMIYDGCSWALSGLSCASEAAGEGV